MNIVLTSHTPDLCIHAGIAGSGGQQGGAGVYGGGGNNTEHGQCCSLESHPGATVPGQAWPAYPQPGIQRLRSAAGLA